MAPLAARLVTALLALAAAAPAQTVVVPNAFADVESDLAMNFPWNDGETVRFQQAYAAEELTALVGRRIGAVAFRADGGFFNTDFEPHLFGDVTIRLSTGDDLVDALSPTFDENLGEDLVLVRTGPYAMPFLEGTSPPNPFDMVLEFTAGFPYEGGDLLVDMRWTGPYPTPQFLFLLDGTDPPWGQTDGDAISMAFSSFDVPTGLTSSGGMVTRFTAASECYLVIGDGPGDAPFLELDHLFQTQLDAVEASHPVLLTELPGFVLPTGLTGVPAGVAAVGGPATTPGPTTDVPPWMWDGRFAVQVLMWNPQAFPGQPEQVSAGLNVRVLPGGGIVTRPFGAGTGLTVRAETDVDDEGRPIVRFPFTIEGL